jgi:pyruvate,water dikinase
MTLADETMPEATANPIQGTPEFPISWEEPWDPEVSWEWDDMHMPAALSPLAEDYVRILARGFNEFYELEGLPQRMHGRVWNGYAYFGVRRDYPVEERDAVYARFSEILRQKARTCQAYWDDEILPEVLELEAGIRAHDVATLEPDALAAAWERAWAATARLWQLHFDVVHIPYQVVEDLADLYEGLFPEAPKGEAAGMASGTHSPLVEVDLGMERLAAIAEGHPELRERLVSAVSGPLDGRRTLEPADLAGLEGAGELLGELEAFIDRHGHLGQNMDDLTLPSWRDEPSMVLANLGARLGAPPEPPEQRRRRLEEQAEALAGRTRERLADEPERLARFEELFGLARSVAPLTEIHNYWIDRMAQARFRTFALQVAERMVRAGIIERRDDVFFLHAAEVPALLRTPSDQRGLIAERRARHAHNATLTPIRNVGAPPPPVIPDRFEAERRETTDAGVLLGTGASAGAVRGEARIALGPQDFARIRPGDIIVCPSSNPSWVPVFTIAGGLVTNTGGVLSHAAVVAREFALPAVVGVADATRTIRDGQTIEIDGTEGTVRLL